MKMSMWSACQGTHIGRTGAAERRDGVDELLLHLVCDAHGPQEPLRRGAVAGQRGRAAGVDGGATAHQRGGVGHSADHARACGEVLQHGKVSCVVFVCFLTTRDFLQLTFSSSAIEIPMQMEMKRFSLDTVGLTCCSTALTISGFTETNTTSEFFTTWLLSDVAEAPSSC